VNITELKKVFERWLILEDNRLIDVVFGTVVANILKGETVNLYIVGPPSGGKTEVLRSIKGYDKVFEVSSLTTHTLFSGFGGKGKKNMEKSLVHWLSNNGKSIVAIKDFTSILSKRGEDRKEILSQIREIADGSYSINYGNEEKVQWSGKIAFMACVTNIIDEYAGVNQMLGERFIYYRLPNGADPMYLAHHAQKMAGREIEMRSEIGEASVEFLNRFNDVELSDVYMTESMALRFRNLFCLIAVGRTAISRDRFTRAFNYVPSAECPPRITKQITQLAAGIAIINDKREIDDEVFGVVEKVGWDTIPELRTKIIKGMYSKGIYGENMLVQGDVAKCIHFPLSTVRTYLEDFEVLKIADKVGDNWGLSKVYRGYIEGMKGE
jgi:hypothetical protein